MFTDGSMSMVIKLRLMDFYMLGSSLSNPLVLRTYGDGWKGERASEEGEEDGCELELHFDF